MATQNRNEGIDLLNLYVLLFEMTLGYNYLPNFLQPLNIFFCTKKATPILESCFILLHLKTAAADITLID